jgi:hypothetical protein
MDNSADSPPAVSAAMHRAKTRARAAHVTVGLVRHGEDGAVEIDCSCGMLLTNGPQWSLDEHIRLHRAEARYLAVSEVAPAGMPRLIPVAGDRRPR